VTDHYDVVIIGTGAGGGTLANVLAQAGRNAAAMRGEEPALTKLAPTFSLEDVAKHAVDFWLTTEDIPRPDNRVTVDGDGQIHLAYRPSNAAEASALYGELRTIMNHIGIAAHHVLDKNFYMHMSIPIAHRPVQVRERRAVQRLEILAGPRAEVPLPAAPPERGALGRAHHIRHLTSCIPWLRGKGSDR
jgi:hypothetical protein